MAMRLGPRDRLYLHLHDDDQAPADDIQRTILERENQQLRAQLKAAESKLRVVNKISTPASKR